jgi:YVTN family beta-propeller protein
MSRLALLRALLPLLLCAPAGAEPNAYVVNEGSASVSVIETTSDEVSATIKVGERPRGLAISASGERLYVSREDGTLIERDMYEKAESAQAKLGRLPSSIRLSPDAKVLAAAIQSDGEVVLLDIATMRVVKKIAVRGKHATAAVFSPDGRWIYASAEESPELAVIDVKQGAVTNSIPVGPRLRGIAFLPGGARAYVAAEQESEVVVIDVPTQAVIARVKTAGAPVGVTPHPDGKRVFVSATGAGKVQVLDTSSNRFIAEVEVGGGPSSMALTPDGHKLYVTCSQANQVSVIDTSTYKRIAQVAVGVTPANVVIGEPPPPPDGGERGPRGGRFGAS